MLSSRSPVPLFLVVALVVLAFAPAAPVAAVASGDAFVVIAVVDTGVNPYHTAFRASTYPRNVDADASNNVDFSAHPSSFIPGFPADAPSIPLTFTAPNYNSAVAADDAVWDSLDERKLYWIPGTKIIGAYDGTGTFAAIGGTVDDFTPILDENGHGTGTASLAAGHTQAYHALCRECLLVVVEGTGGFEWAISQPWIDIVSNSYGATANVGIPTGGTLTSANDPGRIAAEKGKSILFASGNGADGGFTVPVATYTSSTVGPSWFVRVGGHTSCQPGSSVNGLCEAPVYQAGKPADLTGPAGGWIPAAASDHLSAPQEFSGTSAATPIAAGYFGNTLLTLRKAMGDAETGQPATRAKAVVAQGAAVTGTPFSSVAADGKVTREELWSVVFASAATPINNTYYPGVPVKDQPADYLLFGWGFADGRARDLAARVALGEAATPDKPDDRRLWAVDKVIQESLWGRWDRNGDGFRNAADSYQNDLQREIDAILP